MSGPAFAVLALIPARGGSKGIPRKNIRLLGGRPLLAWSVDAARAARHVARVVVSTDDEEIAAVAREAGAEVPFRRPAEYATDTAPSIAPVHHALQWFAAHENWRPDAVALLPPTSPLRRAEDIDAAVDLLHSAGAVSVIAVVAARHHPFYAFRRGIDGRLSYFMDVPARPQRRQDLPPAFAASQAILVSRTEYFERCGPAAWAADETSVAGLPVGEETAFDIDTPQDFAHAEAMLRRRLAQAHAPA
jgi:CMP-N-acetylneuraminic acid synthetase